MSSFAGRMKEYPWISLDRFDRENLHARAYFLSHCHKDHMKGMKGPILKRKLQFSRTVRLYCSFVTKELLLSNPKYAFWEEYMFPLELESPTQISLVDEESGKKEDLMVTLLTAGHCPGSVMFLFEGCQGNVLYTGDFRFAAGDASRIEHLHSGSRVMDIQSVYLDSTFYDPRFYQIPTREVCLNGISKLVGNWISQSPYHVVWLNCKAAYGYEYLFTNLGEEFNTQIHVRSLAMFQKMPEILSYLTTDRKTQIHACRHPKAEEFFQGNRLPCGCTADDGTPLRIISIKPSTMWFGERMRKTNVVIKTGASSFRACFSFHSSYSEIKDFLSYLKPVHIHPSVIPLGRTLTEVTQMLKLMCRNQSDHVSYIYKPLGVLKRSMAHRPTYDSDSSDNELFDGLDLAPVRKKMELIQEIKHMSPQKTAPPVCADASFPVTLTDTQSAARNFVDCTESNEEEEDEEEEEEEDEGKGDSTVKEEELVTGAPTEIEKIEETQKTENKAPKWEDFFTMETLPDSQSSLNSQSQSCCSVPSPAPSPSHSRMTGSQTPDLFSELEEEEEEIPIDNESFQLTLSASASNNSSQNLDTFLPDTLILHPEQVSGRDQGDISTNPVQSQEMLSNSQEDQSDLPDSQVSSDFDVPCTPESKAPRQEELSQLYRKLASGEDVLIRKD